MTKLDFLTCWKSLCVYVMKDSYKYRQILSRSHIGNQVFGKMKHFTERIFNDWGKCHGYFRLLNAYWRLPEI